MEWGCATSRCVGAFPPRSPLNPAFLFVMEAHDSGVMGHIICPWRLNSISGSSPLPGSHPSHQMFGSPGSQSTLRCFPTVTSLTETQARQRGARCENRRSVRPYDSGVISGTKDKRLNIATKDAPVALGTRVLGGEGEANCLCSSAPQLHQGALSSVMVGTGGPKCNSWGRGRGKRAPSPHSRNPYCLRSRGDRRAQGQGEPRGWVDSGASRMEVLPAPPSLSPHCHCGGAV